MEKLTKAEKKVLTLVTFEGGLTAVEIAEKLDLHRTYVLKIMRKHESAFEVRINPNSRQYAYYAKAGV
jgi:hypothetical protein